MLPFFVGDDLLVSHAIVREKNGQVTGLYLNFCCDCCSQSWCGPQGKRARLLDGEKDESDEDNGFVST